VGCFSYKLYRLFQTQHSFNVTIFTLGFRLFFILLQINYYGKNRRTNGSVRDETSNTFSRQSGGVEQDLQSKKSLQPSGSARFTVYPARLTA
jgi:hypothetical protein